MTVERPSRRRSAVTIGFGGRTCEKSRRYGGPKKKASYGGVVAIRADLHSL
jgi:hypothetical protein